MAYSPLIDLRLPPTSPKWSSRQGRRPNGLIVHHWASTSMAGRDRLVYSSDQASANYLIYDDGRLVGSVPEEYRAWTSSSFAADDDKITVEIQNSTAGPDWRVSDAAFATLARLYADVAKRWDFAPVRRNIYGHRDFYATACPGPYLYPRLGVVADRAQKESDPKDWFDMADKADLKDAVLDVLRSGAGQKAVCDAVWNTDGVVKAPADTDPSNAYWGARGWLGSIRAAVQRGNATANANSAALDALAKSAGLDPADVRKTVADAVERSLANLSITLTTEES